MTPQTANRISALLETLKAVFLGGMLWLGLLLSFGLVALVAHVVLPSYWQISASGTPVVFFALLALSWLGIAAALIWSGFVTTCEDGSGSVWPAAAASWACLICTPFVVDALLGWSTMQGFVNFTVLTAPICGLIGGVLGLRHIDRRQKAGMTPEDARPIFFNNLLAGRGPITLRQFRAHTLVSLGYFLLALLVACFMDEVCAQLSGRSYSFISTLPMWLTAGPLALVGLAIKYAALNRYRRRPLPPTSFFADPDS